MNFYWNNEKVSEEEFLKIDEQEKCIPREGSCLWQPSWGETFTWDSSCDNTLKLATTTPYGSGFRFCPFCSKKILLK